MQQAVLINAPQQDDDEGNALMERFMRLQRLGSLLDFPDTPDRLMSRSTFP
jgi:hypothetical protein